MERGTALEEEKFYSEVERLRRIHLERPGLESELRIEAKVTDPSARLVTDHNPGQVEIPPLPDPSDMQPSKVPKDRPRLSSAALGVSIHSYCPL